MIGERIFSTYCLLKQPAQALTAIACSSSECLQAPQTYTKVVSPVYALQRVIIKLLHLADVRIEDKMSVHGFTDRILGLEICERNSTMGGDPDRLGALRHQGGA